MSTKAMRQALVSEQGRRFLERMVLRTPIVGTVAARFALVRFCRMLGTLVGSGVPLVTALRTAREALGNQTLADTVSHAIEEVQRGQSLSESLAGNAVLFPASVIDGLGAPFWWSAVSNVDGADVDRAPDDDTTTFPT